MNEDSPTKTASLSLTDVDRRLNAILSFNKEWWGSVPQVERRQTLSALLETMLSSSDQLQMKLISFSTPQ